jgi:putative ABC transport system permease protein
MRTSKTLKLALNILLHSKLRSWLTITGIVIGVAAVVAIVSIGEGLQQNVQTRLGGLGADIITVSPGRERASQGFRGSEQQTTTSIQNLTKKDLQALQGIENIIITHGTVTGRGEVYYLSEKSTLSIDGVDPTAWTQTTTLELEQGHFLGPADYSSVLIGNRVAKKTFKQELALNRILTIEGKPFKIAGILKESGSGDDNKILMPISAARDTMSNLGQNTYNTIYIKTASFEAVDQVMANADAKLMMARHVNNRTKDFAIRSAKQQQERLQGITQTMTLFLGAIAAVSLIVGAVGIANTMFTSVLEKTREIGIMKAIGATNKDIMLIFLFNAGLVGMVGGTLGIILGSVVSKMIPALGIRMIGPGGGTMTTVISFKLILIALLIAIGIGMTAGILPAYRASKLKPVDALRYL